MNPGVSILIKKRYKTNLYKDCENHNSIQLGTKMMPKLSSFLVLQCLFISLANGRNISEVTEVITSILNLINNSRSIDIKTCWLVGKLTCLHWRKNCIYWDYCSKHYNFITDKQLELVKALNKKYILAKVEKQQKIFYDKSHRNWLLIDANCEEELELLTKVFIGFVCLWNLNFFCWFDVCYNLNFWQ